MHEHGGADQQARGALTQALVRTILESRRAYRMAMALAQEMLANGGTLEWGDPTLAPIGERQQSASRRGSAERYPDLTMRMAKKRSTPRNGLRLVVPHRFDMPLVMPGDPSQPNHTEPTDEHGHAGRKLDAAEGKGARDVGETHG
jgi:hypothetical protein